VVVTRQALPATRADQQEDVVMMKPLVQAIVAACVAAAVAALVTTAAINLLLAYRASQ
jgi:hypothetical protein